MERLTVGARTVPIPSAATPTRPPRATRLAFAAIITLVVCAAASPAPAGADAVATVLPPDGLYLRAAPGTQYPSLDLVPGGTRVGLTGPENESGWYPAVYKGTRGWMRGDFLELPRDAAAITRRAAVRVSDGTALATEPYAAAPRLAMIPLSTAITVSARTTTDGWVLAAHAGLTGWVAVEHLQIEGTPAPTIPATAALPPTMPATGAAALPSAMLGAGPVRGTITYYHPSLEGGGMACGGRYRAEDATIAAATSWPCGTRLRVCYNANCVNVTVQDSGHMGPNWVDLSASAFRQLAPLPEMLLRGTVEVVPLGP